MGEGLGKPPGVLTKTVPAWERLARIGLVPAWLAVFGEHLVVRDPKLRHVVVFRGLRAGVSVRRPSLCEILLGCPGFRRKR